MDWGATDPTVKRGGAREAPEVARSEGSGGGFTNSGNNSYGYPSRDAAGLKDGAGLNPAGRMCHRRWQVDEGAKAQGGVAARRGGRHDEAPHADARAGGGT